MSIENDYATEVRVARRKTGLKTQEFFTPSELVEKMCDKIPEDEWSNPESDFLEPSFGNGNFVIAIIRRKIENGSTWQEALEHTWGVELMADNVQECKERVLSLLDSMNIEYDVDKAMKIMDHNLVCSDFFEWDFENWKSTKTPQAAPLF